MSSWELEQEEERKRKAKVRQDRKYREGYKRAFGVYPEQTWRW